MKIQYPDYENCIANLACSLLRHYGLETPNSTLPQADRLLDRPWRNVVVILLDGMGVCNMGRHLVPDGFFCKNMVAEYSSVFPPTTVASTTAMLSGLTPNQSGWLGWTGYFPEADRNVVYYWNVDNDTGERLDKNAAYTCVPYKSLMDRIKETGTQAYSLAPFQDPFPKSYAAFTGEILRLCQKPERKYIYAYWTEPDHTMHEIGVEREEIGVMMRQIEKETERLCSLLEDTLVIVTADHGHINVEEEVLVECLELMDCLVRMPSMEGRAANLFVKPECRGQFEQAFQKRFGEDFFLLKKEEVLQKQLLGPGENHPRLEGMLGDYLAIATGKTSIANTEKCFLGGHAGLTREEMTIPLIAIKR